MFRGATTVEGDQDRGACASRPAIKAGLDVGCVRESPPPAVRVRWNHPRKIFENSDAKSCILVTTCCEISCFVKITAKKLRDRYIVGPSNIKVGGPISPGPYSCCAYKFVQKYLHAADDNAPDIVKLPISIVSAISEKSVNN